MSAIWGYIKSKHDTGACIHQYNKHKEVALCISLLSIILFLIFWSVWIDYKFQNLEHKLYIHTEFDSAIINEHISLIRRLKDVEPEKYDEIIQKLFEVNNKLEKHIDDYRK